MRTSRAGVTYGLAALVAISTLVHVAYYFPRVVDDLFISLRYAENLAHGRGAVYNVGERVEGYSGPLWMLLQSVGFLLRIDGVTWTKLLALTSLVGIQYGLYSLASRSFRITGWLAWVPSLFCAANSYVINWTVLGLETPLHLAALTLCPVAIDAYVREPSLRTRGWAIASVIVLGMTRPESVLYVGVNLIAPLIVVRTRGELAPLARKLSTVGIPALAALGLLLLVRRFYYGHFVPNTYFVKGSHVSFDIGRLAALWSQGVGPTEAIVWIGGSLLLFVFGWKRKCLAPALSILACSYFTATVLLDWMPSLRHLLPITLFSPLGWVVLADAFAQRKNDKQPAFGAGPLAPLAVLALLGHAAYHLVLVDNRNSPEEKRRGSWIRPKTAEKCSDTILAYRRIEPPHVTKMGPYEMGQISQSWGVLETSAEPVTDSWFAGRDIGAVGYYTGVRVFDTAGLFTKTVSMSREWTEQRKVSDTVIRAMMALRPLGGEIYEAWETALGSRPKLLEGYRIRFGTMRAPNAFIATDRPPPSPAEVLGRYRLMQSRFPQLFHLHTLYGESVGAVMDRRVRIVSEQLGSTFDKPGE
ncbi:MAG: hypothetical protein FWD73_16050 [Polyangiaceae bacterium]|nr:hypothetical protein [Polyangiaceae bacterium]